MCNINLMPTVYVKLMSTVDITKTVIFDLWVDSELMSTVDIILMSIQHFFPTRDTGGNMSALYLVLFIYFCVNIAALGEIKYALKMYISIEL